MKRAQAERPGGAPVRRCRRQRGFSPWWLAPVTFVALLACGQAEEDDSGSTDSGGRSGSGGGSSAAGGTSPGSGGAPAGGSPPDGATSGGAPSGGALAGGSADGGGSPAIHPTCPGSADDAFGGVARLLPGVVEAEDFDPLGYSDSSDGNEGAAYRLDVDVDIKAAASGFVIGWMTAGEWLEYTVDVPVAGAYELTLEAGSVEAGRTVAVQQCGAALAEAIAIPQVGAWGEVDSTAVVTVRLEAGVQVLRVVVGPSDYVDLDSLTLAAAGGGAGTGGAGTGGAGTGGAGPSQFRVYLLIGQSNMAGGATPSAADQVEDPRVRVLGYDACASTGRQYNQWDTAAPPLHACWSNGIGPGDHFAKTLIEALPEGDTIGLVPCAIPGVDVDFFRKGVISARRDEFVIPPDDHWDSAYDWVIERAELAQAEGGVIDGILFHQGESDAGQQVWLDKVEELVADLRDDLGVGDIPFLAGELLYGGGGDGHNAIIAQLPSRIANAHVVSAAGLSGTDVYHFDSPGVRTLGQRYGETMIEALGLGD